MEVLNQDASSGRESTAASFTVQGKGEASNIRSKRSKNMINGNIDEDEQIQPNPGSDYLSKQMTSDQFEKKGNPNKSEPTEGNPQLLGDNKTISTENSMIESYPYNNIVVGTLSLGKIVEIKEEKLVISLPGGMFGFVNIYSISSPYSKYINNWNTGRKLGHENIIHTLRDIFEESQVVAVKVCRIVKTYNSILVCLSTNPSDLHSNYDATLLRENMVITAAVATREILGHNMDTGIKGVTAFLPHHAAGGFVKMMNKNKPLVIGQLVPCRIVKRKICGLDVKLILSAKPNEVKNAKIQDQMNINYNMLLPGMLVDAKVMHTYKAGLKVNLLNMEGHVHQDHLGQLWIEPHSQAIGSLISARVLYVLPNGKIPNLRIQPEVSSFVPVVPNNSDEIKVGKKDKVRIERIEKRGLIIRFRTEERGIVPSCIVSDGLALTEEDISNKFPIGSDHECRVIQNCRLDSMYIASFQKSLLEEFWSTRVVHAGQIVTCKIVEWTYSEASVSFGRVTGYIGRNHVDEIHMTDLQSKYPVGCSITARVLKVNMDTGLILLTAKQSLICSEAAVLSSLNEAVVGQISQGIISSVHATGVIIYTIGQLAGFVPASEVSRSRIPVNQKVLFVGMVVLFRIVEVNLDKKRLTLSLILEQDTIRTNASRCEEGSRRKSEELVIAVKNNGHSFSADTMVKDDTNAVMKFKKDFSKAKPKRQNGISELSASTDSIENKTIRKKRKRSKSIVSNEPKHKSMKQSKLNGDEDKMIDETGTSAVDKEQRRAMWKKREKKRLEEVDPKFLPFLEVEKGYFGDTDNTE